MSQEVAYAGFYSALNTNIPQVKAIKHVVPGSHILEVGCGRGGVTRLLKNGLGCKVTAMDLNPENEKFVGTSAETFISGDITQPNVLSAITARFDYILLFEVLEHLANPEKTLEALLQRDNGGTRPQFLVTLPNVLVWHVRQQFLSGKFEYQDTGTLDRTHLRFFTPRSAKKLLEDSGLRVIQMETTWNVPILNFFWNLCQIPQLENIQEKIKNRLKSKPPIITSLALAVVAIQNRLNHLGMAYLISKMGAAFARIFPVLFVNHVILFAEYSTGNAHRTLNPGTK